MLSAYKIIISICLVLNYSFLSPISKFGLKFGIEDESCIILIWKSYDEGQIKMKFFEE